MINIEKKLRFGTEQDRRWAEKKDRSKRHRPDKKRLDYGIFANNKEILDNKKRKELKQK